MSKYMVRTKHGKWLTVIASNAKQAAKQLYLLIGAICVTVKRIVINNGIPYLEFAKFRVIAS